MKKCRFLLALLVLPLFLASCGSGPVFAGQALIKQVRKVVASTGEASSVARMSATVSDGSPVVQQWVAGELVFESAKTYTAPVYDADVDVVFTHKETGETLTRPAFWDGGTKWVVRFALTKIGQWSYTTVCTDAENTGLGGKQGVVSCVEYTGEQEIYKRGFVRVADDGKYFVYDNGTPFFYLGDTHWTLPMESLTDLAGADAALAEAEGASSQFHYLMNYRRAQGFTVIQSQPLAAYNGLTGNSWFGDENGSIWFYGVNDAMLEKFQHLDIKFQYIAELGFVHANSQLTYPEELIELAFDNPDFNWENAEKLVRYWVARYGAYPVMWTTTQEGDKSLYNWNGCTPEDNPWLKITDMVAKYDAYGNPTTCHQENFGTTRVNDSLFNKLESHDWFAAQMNIFEGNTTKIFTEGLREYYIRTDKPVVNYEGHYDHYWTDTKGIRAQAWIGFFSGLSGFGYGSQPIWSLSWAGNDSSERTSVFGDKYTQNVSWYDGLHSDAGVQLTYLVSFMTALEWQRLVPTFGVSKYYTGDQGKGTVATIGNDVYVGYFYNTDGDMGTLKSMADEVYTLYWFNPRTGEWSAPQVILPVEGKHELTAKPSADDWVLLVQRGEPPREGLSVPQIVAISAGAAAVVGGGAGGAVWLRRRKRRVK